MTEEVKLNWLTTFRELEEYGPPHRFPPRKLAGLYAVASICYHGNDWSPISDDVFDALCSWILKNFDHCEREGADMLDKEMLRSCSGVAVETFVKPYHDVVAMLLGHACQCNACSRN